MDIREMAARYYDLEPEFPDDIPFYLNLIPPGADVLELGCGTGRVTLPLAERGNFVQGIDLSPAMIAVCAQKLAKTGLSTERARVEVGDITRFSLHRCFDWIIAPYRVLQNLETDAQVDGLFACIRAHLKPSGSCVLNVFHPNRDPDGLRRNWVQSQELLEWDRVIDGERVVCSSLRARMDAEKLVLYMETTYRRYRGSELTEEALLKYAMRCYYPDEFETLVKVHNFSIMGRWGGYHGEVYGHGPELVLQFRI